MTEPNRENTPGETPPKANPSWVDLVMRGHLPQSVVPPSSPPLPLRQQPASLTKKYDVTLPMAAAQDESISSSKVRITLPLTPEADALCHTHRLGAASANQRIVYALLARTLFAYRSDRIKMFVAWLLVPFCLVAGALAGFALAGGLGWILAQAGLGDLLVLALVLLVFLTAITFRETPTESDVGLSESDGRLDHFKLGRFEEMFEAVWPATVAVFFGIFFGTQQAVLMFTRNHLGLPISGEYWESFLLTLDNACHGMFFDTFELYSLHWGKTLHHTFYSATVFYSFRLAFDVFAFLIGYTIWKRYRLRSFFWYYPRDERDVPGVLDWISSHCAEGKHWSHHYHDEVIFLVLCQSYIKGEFTFVQQLSSKLPGLNVRPEVRELFVADDGSCLFQSARKSGTT